MRNILFKGEYKMNFYTCQFLYAVDNNIPDQVGHLCIIQSDINLLDIKSSQLKEQWQIKELLDEHDCEDIRLEEVTIDDVKDDYYDVEVIVINKKDL